MIASQPFLRATLGIAASGGFVSALEFIRIRDAFRDEGVLSWEIARLRKGRIVSTLDTFEFIVGWPGIQFLMTSRAILALACVIWAAIDAVPAPLIAAFVVIQLLFKLRARPMMDGADRMLDIVLVTCFITSCVSGELAGQIGLFFIAAQLSLAYATSGLAKIGHAGWRNGRLLREILSTATFGRKGIHRLLSTSPLLARCLGMCVVCGELFWSLSPWIPPRLALIMLAGAVVFHLSVAAIMGLNTFVFAFTAAFPAALYTSLRLYS